MRISPAPTVPTLHPAFRARLADDPWAEALHAAAGGEEPGTVLHAPLARRCTAAIILAPDRPVTNQTVLHFAGLALREALLAVLPPQLPITFDPHGTAVNGTHGMAVNGAQAVTLRIARGPNDPPDWLVLGIDIAIALQTQDPGLHPTSTDLAEEGADITAAAMLESACRHLLAWLDTWQHEGDAAIEAAWKLAA